MARVTAGSLVTDRGLHDLAIDAAFLAANLLKLTHGGWFPLLIASGAYLVMSTWKCGRAILADRLRTSAMPFEEFAAEVERHPPVRVPGTGVFLTAHGADVPPILVHHLRHNKVLHQQIILLTVMSVDVPIADHDSAVDVRELRGGVYRVTARYGFMESPDVPAALAAAQLRGLPPIAGEDTTFYVAHVTLFVPAHGQMARWREKRFTFLARNARRPTNFFHIPVDRVVEIGMQLTL